MTCGPYRPVTLIPFRTRIAAVDVRPRVSQPPSLTPSLVVHIRLDGAAQDTIKLTATLRAADTGAVVTSQDAMLVGEHSNLAEVVDWQFGNEVDLWWPVGYGRQARYILELELKNPKEGLPFFFHLYACMCSTRSVE